MARLPKMYGSSRFSSPEMTKPRIPVSCWTSWVIRSRTALVTGMASKTMLTVADSMRCICCRVRTPMIRARMVRRKNAELIFHRKEMRTALPSVVCTEVPLYSKTLLMTYPGSTIPERKRAHKGRPSFSEGHVHPHRLGEPAHEAAEQGSPRDHCQGEQRDDDARRADAGRQEQPVAADEPHPEDRKSTRLNSSHVKISYAVFCLKKKKERKRGS